jgi:hypothetical protein
VTNLVRRAEWSWWQAGLALGLLNMAAFYTANYYLSVSTTFSRASAMAVGVFAPGHVAANPYWQAVQPIVDWQFTLVLGIPIGAWLAARLSRHAVRVTTALPALWVSRFGSAHAARWALGLAGGVLVGFGARLADGCTSGHGLSGTLQLAVSSWLFMGIMMAAGIVAARLVWRRA